MGKFDDVVIDVIKNETQVSFAIQLKHTNNKQKHLSPKIFETEKGDFSLKKYCESFKSLSDMNKRCQFILYTNFKFDPKRSREVTNFTMIQDNRGGGNMFFDTSSGGGNVYRFEVNDKTPQHEKSDYEIFFSRFKLYVCQKNFEDIEQDMVKILQNDAIDVVPKYLSLFRKWYQHRFTNKKIDKTTVNIHLIDIFLSPFITTNHYFSVGQNKKLGLFEKVIKEFDVTLVNDLFKDFKENLTEDFDPEEGINEKLKSYKKRYKIKPNASADECIMRLAKEIKIIDRSVKVLENEVKLKVLQYFFEKPIIVNFNETSKELIYKIMELHQLGSKIKFILVGQGIQTIRLPRFRIFENLNDLSINEILYRDVTRTCCLSLQGRKETTLEELIDSCIKIREHIGAKEILQMLQGKFLIGQATESLPSFYINRTVSCKVETIDAFLDAAFFMKHLALVKFDGKVKKIQNAIRKRNINVVDVYDYLKSTQISNEPTIISTNEECSKQLLQDISEKSDNKSVVYLRISENDGFLIISIEENQIHCLTRQINILCADPGMGKTTMLKKLRDECDSMFWTIDVELKSHNKFFKIEHDVDELLNHFIKRNENIFSTHIRNVFRSNKKIYFFFDGLDQVERSCVDNVLHSVNRLSAKGFHVWISSRKNLKRKLEGHLGKVAMDIEEVEEEQQKFYIKNRLKEEYNPEQIEYLISKIFNRFDNDSNCHVLGKVLQLYIISQNILDDKELRRQMTEHTFVFTKMYDLFFSGRVKHNRDKVASNNTYLLMTEVEDILEIYELLAVHSVFGEEYFEKLNLDRRRVRRCLQEIKTNKDPLGIVTKVNDEGKAVFEQFTYGEYFAARFFANNFDKARLIREELFSNGHKNLMMILSVILAEDNPLHLAVIYRNVDQIAKYIDHKNVHDKAGRNPLHLATFIEPRCVDRQSSRTEVSIDTGEYLTNIDILKKMIKYNYADSDELFQWTALEYAFGNKSFVTVEIILKRYKFSNQQLHQYTKIAINHNDNILFFCLTHGCRKLLSSIHENSDKIKNYFKQIPVTIIQHTITSCYFQKNKTLRFVLKTLQYKYGFEVDSTNERGETALHLAAGYAKQYAVQILLEKGASVNARTKSDLTPLHYAAERGNSEIVALLIEKGASVNAPTKSDLTPLHYAAEKGSSETIAVLIEKGASVDATTKNDLTPLHYAAERGNSEIVALLIEKGASVDTTTRSDLTPLHYAAQSGNFETVAVLIEKGASVDALADDLSPLHYAFQSGYSKIIDLLIEKGTSVNALENDELTPLHHAALSGNLKKVALLIKEGASVNAFTPEKLTPLHCAAEYGNVETVRLLIEKGAYVNYSQSDKTTPLHLAAISGNLESVKLLIEKGASVNPPTTDNQTPLHWAAECGNAETIALLIEKGACVYALANDDSTPLHLASKSGHFENVAVLIKNGAYVNAYTNEDISPLYLATERENLDTIALLIDKGASVNALTNSNRTPLHWAAECGNAETIALLIEKGACVNALANDNSTPLHLASKSGHFENVALLIKNGAYVNAYTNEDISPLYLATERGNLDTIALLIDKGASVNALTNNNLSPLHCAAECGNSETVSLLIEKGASFNALTTGELTTLHRAALNGNLEKVALLIEKGASVDALTTDKVTPLHLASNSGSSETVSLLIEKGASVNTLADDNITPLHYAAQSGNSEIVGLLINPFNPTVLLKGQ
jgi:ankyrin repeat protein